GEGTPSRRMPDPWPPSKYPLFLPYSNSKSHSTHVTTSTPAKRITFYKSGDSQFGGIRMAVHKRSFKCFDTLLEDLSQKMPLPFGVRTVTTPRGTHTIKHLEQLQDGGCYLCSDQRQAKPINMDLASKRPNIWYHHSQRPHRPETSSSKQNGHLPYRQRRILLVKNSEPGIRRSMVLSRKSARSLRTFLDEVSEVMEFHVRKLFTTEGRRIDNVQSLMTCPGVLVCVGREGFSPMLMNLIRKSSEEKLPASEYSEGHENSSNRSTHFSLSSEKSYGNGISTYSQARPAIMNEDIEKRVLVNKDGSLSVEMRVRFRLKNDETLQWFTKIKKSPSLTNECCCLSQANPCYLRHGQSEKGVDYQRGNHCPCCGQIQEQQYDLWENPAHKHKQPPVPPPHTSGHIHTIMRHTHSSSSSSSCSSRRVVRCQARPSKCGQDSGSEQSQPFQEEICVTEQVERRVELEQNGDTHVEVCRVSRCSEVVTMDSSLRLSQESVEDEIMMEEGEDCPLSVVSNSSHVLQSLKEDQDDELPPSASQCCHRIEPSPTSETHPRTGVSAGSVCSTKHKHDDGGERGNRAVSSCHRRGPTPHSIVEPEEINSNPRMSNASCRSSKTDVPASEEAEGAAHDENEQIKRVVRGLSDHRGHSEGSLQSRASSICPHCGGCKHAVTSVSNSRASQMSHHSHQSSPKPATPLSNQDNANNADDGSSNVSVASTKLNKAEAPDLRRREEAALSSLSAKTSASSKTNVSIKRGIMVDSPTNNTTLEEEPTNKRTSSALSGKSNVSNKLGITERPDSILSDKSTKSNVSVKSDTFQRSTCIYCTREVYPVAKKTVFEETKQEEEIENKAEAASSTSAKSKNSFKSRMASKRSLSPRSLTKGDKGAMSQMSCRSDKSNTSVKSSKSFKDKCNCNCNVTADYASLAEAEGIKSDMAKEETQQTVESEEEATRAGSFKSHKSKCNENPGASSEIGDDNGNSKEAQKQPAAPSSARSHHSNCDAGSGVASSDIDKAKTEMTTMEDRDLSAMSEKSHSSAKSSESQKSNRTAASLNPNKANLLAVETNGDSMQSQQRVASGMSVKSKSSARSSVSHKSNSSKNVQSVSPNVTIKKPEGIDEEGYDTTEKTQSSASTKSAKAKSLHNKGADRADTDEDNKPISKSYEQSHGQTILLSRTCSPKDHSPKAPATPPSSPQSPVKQLLPGPGVCKTRGPSGLSVRSLRSLKSDRSNCHCEAVPAKKENGEEEDEDVKNEEAPENAPSILSSLSKRTRRESGGTEQALSQNSSGSVSLGLPEDTAGSSSVKSSVSFHVNTDKVKTGTLEVPKSTENTEKLNNHISSTASFVSNCIKKNNAVKTNSIQNYENQAVSRPASKAEEYITDNKKAGVLSKSSNCLRNDSAVSAQSDSLNPVKCPKNKSSGSVKTSSSQKKETKIKSSSPSPLHNSRPGSKVETCSDSTLSQSLSAADLLKETIAATRPHSHHSKASDKLRSEKGWRRRNHQGEPDLTPSCLPTASPSEIVSDWLQSIPTDSSMLTLGDELHEDEKEEEKVVEEDPGEELGGEEKSPEDERGDEEEKAEAEYEEEKEEGVEGDAAESSDLAPGDAAGSPHLKTLLRRNWQSSAAVMKVLLSSSLGRCQSLPEVSINFYLNVFEVGLIGTEKQSTVPPCLDSPKATENPSSLKKSSANNSYKSTTDNEQETQENSSSGTPPTVPRAPLSTKLSQDPDPVWILNLLKKLEKQFMNHYVTAVAEFKVRWDLDDSIILDTMMSELRDEVRRRIQSSIEREMKKFQSRAGKTVRSAQPLKGLNLSRESTMTEKRRRMLRVIQKQILLISKNEMTGDFSDQRSDDEYCPCDACVRKKMATRPLKTNPAAAEPPVMMEFDLLKILQLKKSPSTSTQPSPAEEEGDSIVKEEEGRNLAVVQEEEEEDETKEDIKADVILEERIPEVDKETEKEEVAGDEEEKDNSVSDEQKEGKTDGHGAGEEETSENRGEKEEKEAYSKYQCAKNEEEKDYSGEVEEGEEKNSTNTGENETADDEERAGEEEGVATEDEGATGGNKGVAETEGEEEESDKETVKEVTDKGQTTENAIEEAKKCEVSEFRLVEEQEQTADRESRAEASGDMEDDNATNSAANESTLVGKFTERNTSTAAEMKDEDDGVDENNGGEREASKEERASPQVRPIKCNKHL
uniref:Doublecortin domain-containing protein n=1 Tax=Mola mola TaxID=94237 RepID=A0A3Q4AYS8_MOLML